MLWPLYGQYDLFCPPAAYLDLLYLRTYCDKFCPPAAYLDLFYLRTHCDKFWRRSGWRPRSDCRQYADYRRYGYT